jgi:hypothetical protein
MMKGRVAVLILGLFLGSIFGGAIMLIHDNQYDIQVRNEGTCPVCHKDILTITRDGKQIYADDSTIVDQYVAHTNCYNKIVAQWFKEHPPEQVNTPVSVPIHTQPLEIPNNAYAIPNQNTPPPAKVPAPKNNILPPVPNFSGLKTITK